MARTSTFLLTGVFESNSRGWGQPRVQSHWYVVDSRFLVLEVMGTG